VRISLLAKKTCELRIGFKSVSNERSWKTTKKYLELTVEFPPGRSETEAVLFVLLFYMIGSLPRLFEIFFPEESSCVKGLRSVPPFMSVPTPKALPRRHDGPFLLSGRVVRTFLIRTIRAFWIDSMKGRLEACLFPSA